MISRRVRHTNAYSTEIFVKIEISDCKIKIITIDKKQRDLLYNAKSHAFTSRGSMAMFDDKYI